MDVRMPDGRIVRGVPEGITQSELVKRVQFADKVEANRKADRETYDPLKGMSWLDKTRANIGAGMADLIEGGKQIYTDIAGDEADKKASREAVGEKRQLDQRLADSQFGGKALQIAGNVLPTLVVPAGSFARGLGMASNAARVGTGALAVDSAVAGALGGALQPLAEGDSRTLNTVVGGALGGILPLAVQAASRGIGRFTQRGGQQAAGRELAEAAARQAADDVAAGGARVATEAGTEAATDAATGAATQAANAARPGAAAQTISRSEARNEALRQTLAQLEAAERAAGPGGGPASRIRMSVAAQLDNPELTRLEAGSRARDSSLWARFQEDQARSVADAVRGATTEAGEMAARRTQRGANWDARWANAAEHADDGVFRERLAGLRQNIAQARRSPEAVNPKVSGLLDTVERNLDQFGDDFSPAHLQQIRAQFNERIGGLNPTAFQSAPRESSAVRSLITELDDILNQTTGGRFADVNAGYRTDTAALDAAKAAQRVRNAFWTPEGTVAKRAADAAGEIPEITEAGLRGALNTARQGQSRELLLSDAARDELQAVMRALQRQGNVQRNARVATGGGGSATIPNQFAANAAREAGQQIASRGGMVTQAASGLFNALSRASTAQRDRALAEALQDPRVMRAILEAELAAGTAPTDAATRAVLSALRSSAAGASAATGTGVAGALNR